MSELVLVNPRRKRRKTTRRKTAKRPARRRTTRAKRATPTRRRRRTVRRNPKLSFRSITRDALTPALVGAGGALSLDVAFGALPIPANFKTGPLGSLTKIAGALVLGKVAGNVVNKRFGEQATVGAVTILGYSMLKNIITQNMPQLPMSGSDFAFNPYPSMGEYMPMSEYVGASDQLGYMNAGMGVSADAAQEYTPSDGMGEYDYM